MALRNVIEEGDGILRKKARPVEEIDDRIRALANDMEETMKMNAGVGLAAPQVGVLRRVFVAMPDPDNEDETLVYINPEIIHAQGSQSGEEGCLSVPGYVGMVERPEKVTLRALDLSGREHLYEYEGFGAVVISHELDHLDGILYIDKATGIHPASGSDCEEE